jgi:hypothetical protein
MNRDCSRYNDQIWDLAESGQEPDGHIAACEYCLETLENARRTLAMVREAGQVSEYQDCRTSVMSRIQKPASRMNLALVYALPVVIAVVVGLMTIHSKPDNQSKHQQMVVQPKETPHIIKQEVKAPVIVKQADNGQAEPIHTPTRALKNLVKDRKVAGRLNRVAKRNRDCNKVAPTYSIKAAKNSETTTELDIGLYITSSKDELPDDASIMVIVPADNHQQISDRFSYSVTDEETGRTFTCSGERQGDVINIYAEETNVVLQPDKRG